MALANKESAVYALCRPPGHHAATDLFGGFCYLNNCAIAANWLAQQGQRVAILDIDYHHGNGTQEIFYGRSDVLFVSIHADPSYDYPFYWGFADEHGEGAGLGFNYNFPLPLGTKTTAYLATLEKQFTKFMPSNPTSCSSLWEQTLAKMTPLVHFYSTLLPSRALVAKLVL